jgi:hypothetical protein
MERFSALYQSLTSSPTEQLESELNNESCSPVLDGPHSLGVRPSSGVLMRAPPCPYVTITGSDGARVYLKLENKYLAWRVLMGLHRKFIMSFMLVGHTKFAPNRRTFVSSLNDVAEVVNTSADVNMAQLVGTQNGEPVVTVYNWVTFLGQHFRTVPHLKKFHNFKHQEL